MIFYFSATGNTKWQAERAAAALGDEAVDIMTTSPKDYSFGPDDTIGIYFPVYACVAPDPVKDFARQIDPNGAYTYAVCGYSNYTGLAMQEFSESVWKLHSGYGLLMPDNTTVLGYTYDTEETTKDKLATACARMDAIIERIKLREEDVFDSYQGPNPEEDTKNLPGIFNSQFAVTGTFYVNENCIGCGMCEAGCPKKAIEMQDRKPVWIMDHCDLCSACINKCPVEAIEYGDKSQGIYRYTFEKYQKWLVE